MYAYHINVWGISFSLSLKYKQLGKCQFSAFTKLLVEFQYNEQFVSYNGIRHTIVQPIRHTIVQPIYYTHTCGLTTLTLYMHA